MPSTSGKTIYRNKQQTISTTPLGSSGVARNLEPTPTFNLPIDPGTWPAIRAQLVRDIESMTRTVTAGDREFGLYGNNAVNLSSVQHQGQITVTHQANQQPQQTTTTTRQRRPMSAAARRKLSAKLKERWAQKRRVTNRGAKAMTAGGGGPSSQ